MIKWNSVKKIPENSGMEHSYLITNGKSLSIGWYEPEYFINEERDSQS